MDIFCTFCTLTSNEPDRIKWIGIERVLANAKATAFPNPLLDPVIIKPYHEVVIFETYIFVYVGFIKERLNALYNALYYILLLIISELFLTKCAI